VFDYDAARENPPEGDTCVEVTFNSVNKDGCRTDYFCSPHCLAEHVGSDSGSTAIDLDPERLRDLYWEQEMSLKEVADECGGVSKDTVRRRMADHDIPRRSQEVSKPDKQLLVYFYWREHRSAPEIAEQFDVSRFTVLRWMEEYDIPRRKDGHGLNKNEQ
jgi:predicted DNA-binding protein YlxM (UPF0122 family)